VNWLRRGWKLPWPNLRWSKSSKLGNDNGIAAEPVKSFETSTSSHPWTNSSGGTSTRSPTDVRCTVLACWCVDGNDELRNAMCSRISCDYSQLIGVQLRCNRLNSARNVSTQHTCTSHCRVRFFQGSLSSIQLLRRLTFLLTRLSLRSAEKKVLDWNHITVRHNRND
jgi:hypothetical protein